MIKDNISYLKDYCKNNKHIREKFSIVSWNGSDNYVMIINENDFSTMIELENGEVKLILTINNEAIL